MKLFTTSQKSTILTAIEVRDYIRQFIHTQIGKEFIYDKIVNTPSFMTHLTTNSIIVYITKYGPISLISPIGYFSIISFTTDKIYTFTQSMMIKLIQELGLVELPYFSNKPCSGGYLVTKFKGKKLECLDTKIIKGASPCSFSNYHNYWKKLNKI